MKGQCCFKTATVTVFPFFLVPFSTTLGGEGKGAVDGRFASCCRGLHAGIPNFLLLFIVERRCSPNQPASPPGTDTSSSMQTTYSFMRNVYTLIGTSILVSAGFPASLLILKPQSLKVELIPCLNWGRLQGTQCRYDTAFLINVFALPVIPFCSR